MSRLLLCGSFVLGGEIHGNKIALLFLGRSGSRLIKWAAVVTVYIAVESLGIIVFCGVLCRLFKYVLTVNFEMNPKS